MITYIKINGFKSFHNFEMEFTPLTIIAGTNASGKSNLFDALMLLSRLAEVDKLQNAFKEQRGEMVELFTQYSDNEYASEMEFIVEMLVNKDVKDAWGGEAKLKYTRLKYELKIKRFINESGMNDLEVIHESLVKLKHDKDSWINIIQKNYRDFWRPKVKTGRRGTPYISTEKINDMPAIIVPQDGEGGNKRSFPLKNATKTVLSSFDTIDFRHILAAKEEMKSWKFLQLNPGDLRQPTSKKSGDDKISSSGENLAAALYRIKIQDDYSLIQISRALGNFLPNFTDVNVIDDKENSQFLIKLKGVDGKEYTSRVLSEGTLRLLALCILQFDESFTGLLCFEEPENGIHPFRIKAMAKLLKDLSTDFSDLEMPLRQVIVNTHSPALVLEMVRFKNDKNVSVHYSEMKTSTMTINNKRICFNYSKITKYIDKVIDGYQQKIEFTEQDIKLTLATINEFLNSSEQEIIRY